MMKADPFDKKKFPYGKLAGANRYNAIACPICHKPPTHPTADEYPQGSSIPPEGFFLFRNEISAKEYYISGLCQACQDSVFGSD